MICSHRLTQSEIKDYAVCQDCGTYKSLTFQDPSEVYTPEYWTHEAGHSTLEEQVWNCDTHLEGGKSKYQYVLERIQCDRHSALEIGCAPGRFLQLLKGIGRFERVVGIEACEEYEGAIRQIGCFGGELLFGFFPFCADGLTPESFDLITGLDVLEHSPEPVEFLLECRRLLKKNAQLLVMLPLASESLPERFYLANEHIWMFSQRYLLQLLSACGFDEIQMADWCPGHTLVSARRI